MDRLNLDPLRDVIDLVALAEKDTQLKKSGKNHVGKCPFHDDSTASFTVYVGRDGEWRCHCFGACDFDDDAIGYVMRREHLEFMDAVKWLADYYRIDLPKLNWSPEAVKAQQQQIAASEVLTRAAKFYAARMWAVDEKTGKRINAAAADYGLGRGFKAEHIKAALWGYSKADDALLKVITRDAPEMLPIAREIGLIRADGLDFCANANGAEASPEGWIIYPHVKGGKVTYLSARALNKATKDKSRNIPGQRQIYRADVDLTITLTLTPGLSQSEREVLRLRDDGLVLVEGPADAESVRAWRWPAWAMCGSPIDEENNPQLMAALRKKAERQTIYAAMSNDTAGRKFAEKIADALGPLTRVVFWPKVKPEDKKADANDCLRRGMDEDAIAEVLDLSWTYLDLVIEQVEGLRDVRRKADGIERLASMVSKLDETERKVYIGKVADAELGVSRREFEKMVNERIKTQQQSAIEIRGGMLTFYGDPLINAVVRVENELIVDDGLNAPAIEYHITGKLPDGRDLPGIDVPADEFDGMKWIGKQWGARVYPLVGGGKGHLLKRAILETSLPNMKTDRVYTFTGLYTVGGQRSFLSATGALSAQGLDETARVDLTNNLAHYALPKPVTGADLLAAYRTSLAFMAIAPTTITATLWAVMYGAVLSQVKSLNAVMQVYGPTQSKKSTITHLALTHFGQGFVQGRDYKAPMDWTSTAADIEAKLFTCKDVPVIIDDYAPQFTSAQESRDIAKRAHYVIRSVGNRSSRGRRNADMTAKAQYIPRGSVIMTAEQPLVGQSIVGRTVVVPIEYGSIDLGKLSAAQDTHHLYGLAMSGFVQWTIVNLDRIKEQSGQLVPQWLKSLAGAFPNQDRLADYYAALRLGLHWGLLYGQEIGAIDGAANLEEEYAVDLITLLDNQSARVAEQSPVLKFFQALDDLITGGQVQLLARTTRNGVGEDVATQTERGVQLIGWKVPEERRVWLLTSQALIAVKEYWAGLDERFDTLADALRREMWQYGYVPERDDAQLEITKWVNKTVGNKRVLIVDAEKVRENFGVDLMGDATPVENSLSRESDHTS